MSKDIIVDKTHVFQLKGIRNKSMAKLKYIDSIAKNTQYNDEVMTSNDIYGNVKVNEHHVSIDNDIIVKFNKAMVTDSYLLSSKKIPIMYASVIYDKKFISGVLLNITIHFTITDTNYKTLNSMVGQNLIGNYSITVINDDMKINTDTKINNFKGYDITAQDIIAMLKNKEYTDLIKKIIVLRDKERLVKYGDPSSIIVNKPLYNITHLANNRVIDTKYDELE